MSNLYKTVADVLLHCITGVWRP